MKNMMGTRTTICRLLLVGLVAILAFPVDSAPASSVMEIPEIVLPPGYTAEVLATSEVGFGYADMAFRPDDELIVSAKAASRVPCDSYIASITPEGVVSRFAEPCIDSLLAVTFAPGTGNLLFFAETAGYWDHVYTVPDGGTAGDVQLFASGFVVPLDLEFGPDGDLYVADVHSGTVYKVGPGGTVSAFASGFTADTSGYPTLTGNWLGIAFDPAGALFVSDGGAGTIYSVSADGTASPFASGLTYPTGIAFAEDGALFVADASEGVIYSVSPDGVSSPYASGLRHPRSLAIDSNGALHVIDHDSLGYYPSARIIRIPRASPLTEQSSTRSTLVEAVLAKEGVLGAVAVTGDFEATLEFTSFEIVTIATGPFAGKGFSSGQWHTNLEGIPYEGEWQGVAVASPAEDTIYLKGRVSGGIWGTVEGSLTEDVAGSGVYDHYDATWKAGRLGSTTTSATLNLGGPVNYHAELDFPGTELHVLQASFDGTIAGSYAGPLSAVLTHVRVMTGAPYEGEGFSIMSYAGDSGSGSGWTYDQVVAAGTVKLSGLFGAPFFGVVSATLTETELPRSLFVTVLRVDLGLPPMADLEVLTWGPGRVSPGQTISYVVEARNQGPRAAENVVVVDLLPSEVDYLSSTDGGIYKWESHEVFWRLGTLPPNSKLVVSATVRARWGLPQGTLLPNTVLTGTTSDEIDAYKTGIPPICDLSQYLDYEPPVSGEMGLLDSSELGTLLLDPEFADMYGYAKELGYEAAESGGSILTITYENGVALTGPMMVSSSPDEFLLVAKFDDPGSSASFLVKITDNGTTYFDREGGVDIGVDGSMDVWGEHHSCSDWACGANCILEKVPGYLAGKIPGIGQFIVCPMGIWGAGSACITYWSTPPDDENKGRYRDDCLEAVGQGLLSCSGVAPGLGDVLSWSLTIWNCTFQCIDNRYSHPGFFMCDPNSDPETTCRDTLSSRCPVHVVKTCGSDCKWHVTRDTCERTCDGASECCSCGSGGCGTGWTSCDCPPPPAPPPQPGTGSHTSVVATARDPNIKYGPAGNVSAGETLDYKVEYENEGEGIAFGVYFTDRLDDDLDDSTLAVGPVIDVISGAQIAPSGTYNPETRTITWLVGEVGPGQGGYAEFNVDVRGDAPEGTEIINFATVYFPSVPEETRTNGVISVVGLDSDDDGLPDDIDNCPFIANPEQADLDGDGMGDACDPDDDGDSVDDAADNCPVVPNPDQADLDGDGMGDACDPDDDGDGVEDVVDACPLEDSTGYDADNNGCIDKITDLRSFFDTLFEEEAIDATMHNSLHAKIDAAVAAATRDNVCAAVNVLDALKNQIEAQTGKKISEEAAPVLLEFVTNVQNYMLWATGVGSC